MIMSRVWWKRLDLRVKEGGITVQGAQKLSTRYTDGPIDYDSPHTSLSSTPESSKRLLAVGDSILISGSYRTLGQSSSNFECGEDTNLCNRNAPHSNIIINLSTLSTRRASRDPHSIPRPCCGLYKASIVATQVSFFHNSLLVHVISVTKPTSPRSKTHQ